MIDLGQGRHLDPRELQVKFIRSPGAGGQNVNKVETAVQLRFDVSATQSLPESVKQRLLRLAGARATSSGEIVLTAHRFRTQEANRRDAVERLVALIRRAMVRPKARIATRPGRAAKERRVAEKKKRGDVKRNRGRPEM